MITITVDNEEYKLWPVEIRKIYLIAQSPDNHPPYPNSNIITLVPESIRLGSFLLFFFVSWPLNANNRIKTREIVDIFVDEIDRSLVTVQDSSGTIYEFRYRHDPIQIPPLLEAMIIQQFLGPKPVSLLGVMFR